MRTLKPGISGYTICRNANSLDYCIFPCVQSLLDGCDEVVVGESSSDDGTKEMLHEWASRESRLRIIDQIWSDPIGDPTWFVRWINETRSHLKHDQQLALDADEVFDPSGYAKLRKAPFGKSYTVRRLNFWRDAHHLIPNGRCCSHKVTRFGPTQLQMTSDEIYRTESFPGDEPEIRRRAEEDLSIQIFHYGFLRKREALFEKCKVVLRAFFNTYDERLVEAEKHPELHWTEYCHFDTHLLDWLGEHPKVAHDWLLERKVL